MSQMYIGKTSLDAPDQMASQLRALADVAACRRCYALNMSVFGQNDGSTVTIIAIRLSVARSPDDPTLDRADALLAPKLRQIADLVDQQDAAVTRYQLTAPDCLEIAAMTRVGLDRTTQVRP